MFTVLAIFLVSCKLEANSGSKKAQYGTVPSLKGACLKGSAAARPKAVQKVAEICILHRHTIPVQPKRGDDGKIGIGGCRLSSSFDICGGGRHNKSFLSNQHFGQVHHPFLALELRL